MTAILRYELARQLRRPATWVYAALLAATVLGLVAAGASPAVGGSGYDAPVRVAAFALFTGLLATLVTAALFVEAGHRDVRWRMDALFFTAPLQTRQYLGGRFLGVLAVNALLLLAIPAALAVGTLLPQVRAELHGPFRPGAYLLPYLLLLLPNLLLNAAVLFGVTVLTRRSLPGYLGALALLATYLITMNEVASPEGSTLAALLDPTGAAAMMTATRDWTRAEQDARLVGLGGLLLWNRLLWTSVAAGMLAFTLRRFRFGHAVPAARRRGRCAVAPVAERPGVVVVPTAARAFGPRARLRQALAAAWMGFRHSTASLEFVLAALGLATVAVVAGLGEASDGLLGTPMELRTSAVLGTLTHSTMALLVGLLTAFLAGELAWRERDAGIEKLGDSAPVPDWVPLVGDLLGLALLLVVLQTVLLASGIALQLSQGQLDVELGTYLRGLFGLRLVDYLLFAVLALLVHTTVNAKYVGHLVAAFAYVAIAQAGRFGVEHRLLVYGADPGWVHSEMAGFGPFLPGVVLFKAYWVAWALLLGVVALLLRARGAEPGTRARLRAARRRLTPRVAAVAGLAMLLVAATGGYAFHATNVVGTYRTARESQSLEAEYERRYKRFETAPQPWLAGVRLHLELYPGRRELAVRGRYTLVNRSGVAIDSVHLSSFRYAQVALDRVTFDRAATRVLDDAEHGYRIFALDRPLGPGDSLRMDFAVRLAPRGMPNGARTTINTAVVANGTYLQLVRVLPHVGYQRELLELTGTVARQEHGLPPRAAFPSLDDERARRVSRSSPTADWIEFEATVGTAGDQIAVLPGTLQRSWREGGRRYFHYRAESPILPSLSLASARYAVHEAEWRPPGPNGSEAPDAARPVTIRVLHHPAHEANVARMVEAARASLDYLTAHFGPYPHPDLSLVEIPGYEGTFGRTHPAQLVFTENHAIAIGRADDDRRRMDGVFLVVAHEIAHQWWGHQLLAADVEGSQMLSETLAQYSALMAYENTAGAGAARSFLRTMQLGYVDARGDHAIPEVPLLRAGAQEYVHYRKGLVAMYALRDYVGEEPVSAALRRLVERHGRRGPPYATTLDLHRELHAVTPDSLRPLLDDLTRTITLWDLQAAGARAEPTADGDWRVTLDVDARKLRQDDHGRETAVPMNDLVEIAVFGELAAAGGVAGEPLYLGRHRLRSGRQSVTVTVPRRPSHAAVDPYHKLIVRHLAALLGAKTTEVRIEGR